MDLHVYRNSQDRWHHLRDHARERGAVLAVNAVTLDELVRRITPDITTATVGQRLTVFPNLQRYFYDAVSELKASRVRPHELRAGGADLLADGLERYDKALRTAGVCDPQDRYVLAGSRVREGRVSWLQRFDRVVLHALYDLTEAEFIFVESIIEALPEGGTVEMFNTTANVKPTQFAEWTWQRFLRDDSLAEKTFPDFCRPSQESRAVLERLFVFESEKAHEPLPPDDTLRIVEAASRYKEVEKIGADIADVLSSGASPNDVAVVVRHIETYGEMLEDVFTRYGVPHIFETGVPLVRFPFIKYWLAMLDLVTSERSRAALSRVMSSAYFNPRLSPDVDVERQLGKFGYIDRRHLPASALAARKNSQLAAPVARFENLLDDLEQLEQTLTGFLERVQPSAPLGDRDRQAWRVLAEEVEAVAAIHGHRMRFAEFRKIVSDIAGLRTVGRSGTSTVAPGVPRVRIVHPRSLGFREYAWVFAPGFCDGEFPARSQSNPLLPDETVEAINQRIRPRRLMRARDRNRREPLYLFMILDTAKRVTLSYPAVTLEGDPIYPSVYIGELARHYSESPVSHAKEGPPRADGEWRSRVAGEWRRATLTEDRARELLGDGIVGRVKLESKGILRARIARNVLPLDGVWNPSELNALSSCPFVFFAGRRLKLRAAETPDFEVPALEIGIFAHAILREFYAQPVLSSVDEARVRMDEVITRHLSAADVNGQGAYSVFDPSLWKIRRRQLVSVLTRYVSFAVRDALDGFETQPEYLDAPLPSASLGQTVLAGKPDHVAVRREGDRIEAVRIDDFKYSAASSGTARMLKQSFQIPIYAWLALRALGAEAGVRVEGRYLLLRSPGNPVVSNVIDESVFQEVRDRIDGLLVKVREGHLEPDPADKQGCVECDYRRLCRLFGG